MQDAHLVLASGETFPGQIPDGQATVSGECVFNTGMVGYEACLTDPSYYGQLLCFTYPLLGNYGVLGPEHWESEGIKARALICDQISLNYYRQQAQNDLLTWCQQQNCAVLTHVDTRALTLCLRTKGVIAGAIVPVGQQAPDLLPDINNQHLVRQVSISRPITSNNSATTTIIVVDCGMKANILRILERLPVQIKRVPFDYDFTDEEFAGVLISNGPGDPKACRETSAIISKLMQKKPNTPIFGICLGAQLMALAVGAKTYKLPFGHRSQNQPCLHVSTDKCYLTSQNHGYAIDETSLPPEWQVTFRNLNDNSVQGIAHKDRPYFAAQFHPEAAPGPTDTEWLFEKFYQMIQAGDR